MANQFDGQYIVRHGGQWLGPVVLIRRLDKIEIETKNANEARIKITGSGHLVGPDRGGEIKFESENSKRAIGYILAPKPSVEQDDPENYVAYRVAVEISDHRPYRHIRIIVITVKTPSDDNGGEWDGEEGP